MDKKWIALLLLVIQTSSHSLAIRYSRTKSPNYSVASVVFISEILKALACTIVLLLSGQFVSSLSSFLRNPLDSLKMIVPAACYFLQNNLTFIALGNLNAATYQVLSVYQWTALVTLFIGVCIVQLGIDSGAKVASKSAENPTLGLICVVTAAVSSGFSAIYFEKVIKTTPKSLWFRNLELAFFSVVFGSFSLLEEIANPYLLIKGYDATVCLILFLQSAGGLLVGYIVKYADNLNKVFACAIAFVVSTAVGIIFFNMELTAFFVFGSSMVLGSIGLYSLPPPATPKKTV
ncbi:hypothetical protein Ciccas_009958 [Cichlidogyrus casuarinus]|uniref:UDP-N-acetylglucosamine transporter n=1 Tax=Cichlidogyrus casuarinus TaxID=1844966 RepID=A0ABD2PVI9_9PLAT